MYKDRQCYVSVEANLHLARTPRSAVEVENAPGLCALVLAAASDPAPQANGRSTCKEFVFEVRFYYLGDNF